jgi:tetratricopeptide (TPR) repeat protein
VHIPAGRLAATLETWLRRAIVVAVVLVAMLGLAAGVVFVRNQFFSSSSSALEDNEQQLLEAVLENPNDPDLRVALGDLYLRERKYGEAIEQFNEALKADENRADALMGLGMAYQGGGDKEQAFTAFTRVVEVSKDTSYAAGDLRLEAAYYYLGAMHLERDEFDEAVESLLAALAIEPTDADAMYVLGNAYRAQGEYEGAVAVYGLATSYVPDFREAYEGMAAAAAEQGDSSTATYARAMIRLFSGEVEAAVGELEQVTQQSPDNASAYFGLGYGYEQLGQASKALAAYQQSVSIDPTQFAAQSGLARLGGE